MLLFFLQISDLRESLFVCYLCIHNLDLKQLAKANEGLVSGKQNATMDTNKRK